MNKNYTDATFNAALARAHVREAAEIQAAIAGNASKSVDVRETLDRSAQDRMAKALALWMQ